MNNSGTKQVKAKLFNPQLIATQLLDHLNRDYDAFLLAYKGNDYITRNAFDRQRSELLKKFVPPSLDQSSLEQETYDKFLAINSHMLTFNIKNSYIDIKPGKCMRSDSFEEKVLKRVKPLMAHVLGDFMEEELFLECQNSSGTSIGVPFKDTAIDKKFLFPLSVTKSVVPLFDRYLAFDTLLNSAIQTLNSTTVIGERYNIVEGSRATTVDKSSTSRRMIGIEPTCNMFLQQGLMMMMYKRLKCVGLDVAVLPDLHKTLAKDSSIHGLNATIDFSSASDCVSIELLRRVLPAKWFLLVDQLRCRTIAIQGVEHDTHMISSMGNAGTFPLELLVFWTFAIAVIQTNEDQDGSVLPNRELFGRASVFGDDCIVPTIYAHDFMSVMESVGFIVNKEKSFYGSEQFRESCGGDYLSGYDNRPFCLKAPTGVKLSALEPWLYIMMNSILKKYFMYFGATNYLYDRSVFTYFLTLFRKYNLVLKIVPVDFPDDAGFKMSVDIQRFLANYPFKVSRITKSIQGTYSFRYCRYTYRQQREINPFVRYATKLKNYRASAFSPWATPRRPILKTPRKLGGGYVVAKGISCHWQVPEISGT